MQNLEKEFWQSWVKWKTHKTVKYIYTETKRMIMERN